MSGSVLDKIVVIIGTQFQPAFEAVFYLLHCLIGLFCVFQSIFLASFQKKLIKLHHVCENIARILKSLQRSQIVNPVGPESL